MKKSEMILKDLETTGITTTDLQVEMIGQIIIKEYREQLSKRTEDGGYMNILAGYISSIIQDFEIYLRIEVDIVEDDIKLVSGKYISRFITYKLEPGIYFFKVLSEPL